MRSSCFYVSTAINHSAFHGMVVYRTSSLLQMVLSRMVVSYHISCAFVLMNFCKSYRTIGLVVSHQCFSVMVYADDFTLQCPSVSVLKTMLSICTSVAADNDILFSVAKSIGFRCSRHPCDTVSSVITLCGEALSWTNSVIYLGHKLAWTYLILLIFIVK